MHPYLPHLLADIKTAHCQKIPLEQVLFQTFEDEMEEMKNGQQPKVLNILSAIIADWNQLIFRRRNNLRMMK